MHDFVALAVCATHSETTDAMSVTLAVPEAMKDVFRFKAGQHLAVRAKLDGEDLRRTYSICSHSIGSETGNPTLTITIKRIAGGRFSNWALDNLTAGMSLDALPPSGRFILPDDLGDKAHILAIAAGAGITPIVAIAEHALRHHARTRFTLIYGNRDPESTIFRTRIEDIKDTYLSRFTIFHFLSRSHDSETPLLEGRITPAKIQAMAGRLFDISDIDHAYLCGPGAMIRDLRKTLLQLGLPRDRVHQEFFAPVGAAAVPRQPQTTLRSEAAQQPAGADLNVSTNTDTAEIVAIIDGIRHRFSARSDEPIVDAALRAGIRAPYACKGGMCSTCRARVIEGHTRMRANYSLEPWELEKGFVLTCQALAESDHVVVDFDDM
ncbi:MAG: 2Fe-2S iron-sulfur cluster-binding protein [Hyphomicrobiaceae bacterium]